MHSVMLSRQFTLKLHLAVAEHAVFNTDCSFGGRIYKKSFRLARFECLHLSNGRRYYKRNKSSLYQIDVLSSKSFIKIIDLSYFAERRDDKSK